jgi:selenocysteine-specific translation elongation factor
MSGHSCLRCLPPFLCHALLAGGEGASSPPQGLQELTEALLQMVPSQPRAAEGPFLFAIDHCFPIKGQGTVLTGTCLQVRHLGAVKSTAELTACPW